MISFRWILTNTMQYQFDDDGQQKFACILNIKYSDLSDNIPIIFYCPYIESNSLFSSHNQNTDSLFYVTLEMNDCYLPKFDNIAHLMSNSDQTLISFCFYTTELLYKAIRLFAADAAAFQDRAKYVDKKKYGKCIH